MGDGTATSPCPLARLGADVRTAIALFTRDLRVADNPMLVAAAEADRMAALFVLDDGILRDPFNRPNRAGFLTECLSDLRDRLRRRGADLVVRSGEPATQVTGLAAEIGATEVHVAGDVSGYARRREERLHRRLAAESVDLRVHADVTFVVPAGRVVPQQRDHMAVFTPYYRRWLAHPARPLAPTPRRLPGVRIGPGRLPSATRLCPGDQSPDRPAGGETAGRHRMLTWLRRRLDEYAERSDDLAADATSRLSAYLHFGCVSAHELRARAADRGGPGAESLLRQLAWRDFHAQVLAAHPELTRLDYRPRGDRWHRDTAELSAWRAGRTGVPIVDAGMRQLLREGWMHNRTRLLAAHFLTKILYLDWRRGAAHFTDLLVDADVANNTMNWQWAAGTGTDTRPNRVYNLARQAQRYDPDGDYVRRYVPELTTVPGAAVHEPWRLPASVRARLDYPEPIADVHDHSRFRVGRRR